MVEVTQCSFFELESEPNFSALLEEYAQESYIDGMTPVTGRMSMYREFDRNGSIATFKAVHEGVLIGFMVIISPVLPHYSQRTAIAESFFVTQEGRSTRAGLKLLAAGEGFAQKIGSPGFFCSAPTGSSLEQLLPLRGYRETNKAFFKRSPTQLAVPTQSLPTMTEEQISRANQVEAIIRECPQARIPTFQMIHGGVYTRTVKVPAGNVIASVFIKIPTTVIVVGAAKIFIGEEVIEVHGHNVLPAGKGRKQVFLAITDIFITMIFPTKAKTTEEAEAEFTDDVDDLMSRRDEANNYKLVTEE